MSIKDDLACRAHALYNRSHQGILSTISQSTDGFPFGSVTIFARDARGWPVIHVSTIAEHMHNIEGDSRISLIMLEAGEDIQAAGRLTLLGKAVRVARGDAATKRFRRRFPHTLVYERVHSFHFYAIEPVRIRYVAEFRRIEWLEPSAILHANPFTADVEHDMVSHVNEDHGDALQAYCRMLNVETGSQVPRLTGVDGEGFDLMVGKRLVRIDFDTPVTSTAEVEKAMIALARRAAERPSAVA